MNEGPERIDYRETSDVTEVHGAIKREHGDPHAETTPIPLWLSAVCGAAICWAGIYLGVFHGGFSSTIYNEYDSSPVELFPIANKKVDGTKPPVATLSLAQQGKAVYSQCITCHQPTGMGIAGQFPPLAKSEFVLGGEKRLIAILLKGIQGTLTVEGKQFNGVMPPWEGSLNDKKISAVASYVRSEWGNAAPEISEAKVAAARKEFAGHTASWTEAELLQIPADATLPDAAGVASAAPATNAPVAAAKTAATGVPGAPDASPKSSIPENVLTATATPAADPAVLAQGKIGYMTICFACHQPTGLGLPPVFPPLVKTEYVLGDPKRLAAMILKGVMGPITVDGKPYTNVMPGQELVLNDEKIAAILTYVRSSFGNSASPVSPEIVASARKEFIEKKTSWTEIELKAFDATVVTPAPEVIAPPIPTPIPVPVIPSTPPATSLPEAPAAPALPIPPSSDVPVIPLVVEPKLPPTAASILETPLPTVPDSAQ